MGSVQAVIAPPADSLVVSDIMMADEMEDFVGHSASDGPEANENLGSSADQQILFDGLRSALATKRTRCSAIGLLAVWSVVAANREEAALGDH
jgi:hypothetical protein